MSTKNRRHGLVLLSAVFLVVTTAVFVQAQDHEDGVAEGDCNVDVLLEHQQAHASALETFGEDLNDDLDTALEALYVTGIAYQALALNCGFTRISEAEARHDAEHGITAEAGVLEAAMSIGNPENGQLIFDTIQPEAGFACATCHQVDSMERLIGPGLLGIGNPEHDPAEHAQGDEMMGMDMDDHGAADTMAGMDMDTHAEATDEVQTVRPLEDVVDYIRTSILHPSEYVVPGYPDNLMPQVYGEIFTETEIDDLVAYLLTLQ